MSTPAGSLLEALDAELAQHAPFAWMAPPQRRRFLAVAEQVYAAPGEVLLAPELGAVTHLYLVRRGQLHTADDSAGVGDLFPLQALLRGEPVAAPWRAEGDAFCLRVPAALVHELAAASPPFADFVHQRVLDWLALSQRRLQAGYAEEVLARQTLAQPLARFVNRPPLALPPHTPLGTALLAMHERRVGSVLVVGETGQGLGILTRHDLLARVLLPGKPMDTPLAEVMSAPLATLSESHTAHDAALLMSARGLRHVPVTDAVGRVTGIVSERDLFALQRLSLRQLGGAIDGASDRAALREAAADIRRFAGQLFAQGVLSRSITELVSRLNDRLTARLVQLLAIEQGLDLGRACWLAFGSEGRGEQTVATDQDNGLVFESEDADAERPRWLALGRAVNQALADCGFPLCRGGIMAGEPACCLSGSEWLSHFTHRIEHGAPNDLLRASIFFDLRPLAGNTALAVPLRALITSRAAATPRFLKQLADNALRQRPPLAWLGGFASQSEQGHEVIDLKLQGSALFVEAARLLALGQGVAATGTAERLRLAAGALGVPDTEAGAWVAAFEHLQLLRLHAQLGPGGAAAPNQCRIDGLNDLDRRLLRESLRVAQRLQQRLALDYAA